MNTNAFPTLGNAGLTKREYFAALALQGLLVTKAIEHLRTEHVAGRAVAFADALLAELQKGE